MCVCYGLIVHRLFRTRMTGITSTSSAVNFTQSFNSGPAGSQKRKRKLTARSDKDRIRVTLMYCALVVSFFVLWLPFHSLHLAKLYGIPHGVSKLFSPNSAKSITAITQKRPKSPNFIQNKKNCRTVIQLFSVLKYFRNYFHIFFFLIKF